MTTDTPDYRERLEAKLQPARIRSTLAFAGLFQVTHELLKRSVLHDVKAFFGYTDVNGGVWMSEQGRAEYQQKVLKLDQHHFRAFLLWLQGMDVLTPDEVSRLDDIYEHRHKLTHELMAYLGDPDLEPDAGLFIDALTTLRKISRFWTEVERDIGTFGDFDDLDLDDVVPASIAMLGVCIEAYYDGLRAEG